MARRPRPRLRFLQAPPLGAGQLGVELDQHIAFVIEALELLASELGIAGTSS